MSKQEYTVFSVDDEGAHCFRHVLVDSPQGAADEYARIGSYTPVAWIEGRFRGNMDDTKRGALAAIAAGRLIEKTASGWVALGAEKQANTFVTVEQDLRDIQQILDGELRKGEPTSAEKQEEGMSVTVAIDVIKATPEFTGDAFWADAAMIARDGPAKPVAAVVAPAPCPGHGKCTYPNCSHFMDVSCAKPNPFQNYTAPDCDSGPSDHLNASRHQMAGMKG